MAGRNGDGLWATTGKYGGPRRPQRTWQPCIPSWEKKFCTTLLQKSWKKICEIQKDMWLFPEVRDWNDSAAKEAFENAKARYYAQINGLPCYVTFVPLPYSNLYIDVVDYDAVIDPELVEDLSKQSPVSDDKESDLKTEQESSPPKPIVIVPTGWDDSVEDPPYINDIRLDTQLVVFAQPTGRGDAEDAVPTNDAAGDPQIWNANDASYIAGNSVNIDMYGNYGDMWNNNYGCGEGAAQYNMWGTEGYQTWNYSRENPWGYWENRKNELTTSYQPCKYSREDPWGDWESRKNEQTRSYQPCNYSREDPWGYWESRKNEQTRSYQPCNYSRGNPWGQSSRTNDDTKGYQPWNYSRENTRGQSESRMKEQTRSYQPWNYLRENRKNEQSRSYYKKRDGGDRFGSKNTNLKNQWGHKMMKNNWRSYRGRNWNSAYGTVNH